MSKKHKAITEKSLRKAIEIAVPPYGFVQKTKVKDALDLASDASRGGHVIDAIAIYEKIIQVAPRFPLPFFLQAKLQLQTGNREVARDLVVRALNISAGSAEYYLHAGILMGELHDNEVSLSLIEKAFKLAPKHPDILTFYAEALAKHGETELAIKYLKRAIGIAPEYVGAYLGLSGMAPEKIDSVMLEKINRLVEGENNPDMRAQLLFSAARAYAHRGDYDMEFQCLDRGNAIIRKWTSWTWQADYEAWKQIEKTFSSDFIEKIKSLNCQNIKPIIFSTLPRSGTTLLEQIISSHVEVSAAGESNLFHGPLMEVSRRLFNTAQYWSTLDESNVAHYLEEYTGRVSELLKEQKLDKIYITDKSLGNFSSIGAMLSAFPQAKVIHCVRDPLDISLSCYQHYFAKLFYTSNLEDMARMCSLFDCSMRYWKTIFPVRIMTVKYEDLVENPEAVVRDVMSFLGLEWQADCLDFYKNNAIVHTASRHQVRNPINKSRLARWKKYEKYLEPAVRTLKKDLDTD